MNISEAGLKLIERFEGFRSAPYQDSVGVWTIAYGHTAGVGPGTPPMSEAQGEQLLRQDVTAEYGAAVNNVGVPLNPNEFDATTSFVYNLGPGVLMESSTFGHYLRAKNYRAAADSMLAYDHAGGVVLAGLAARRQAERDLFLTPYVPPDPYAVLLANERFAVQEYEHALRHPHLHRVQHDLDALVRLRKQVWHAAVRGRRPDGTSTKAGWNLFDRAARYRVLCEVTHFPS